MVLGVIISLLVIGGAVGGYIYLNPEGFDSSILERLGDGFNEKDLAQENSDSEDPENSIVSEVLFPTSLTESFVI